MICCTLSWSPFLIIWLILILTTCRDMGSKIVKCIFLWFCQIFFPWHWWRVLAMTPKTLLCGGDSWRMLLWARVYQYVACHDTHLLCLLVAYLPWYPPCLVPTWCLLLWFIRSVPHHPACSRLLYANLCPIYAAVLNIYAAVFSAINSKSIWRQNGWRMSWQGRLYKWILFCLEVLARIEATRAPCLAGR